jgi:D-beta-D-heptose 7-phosphate kinase/D-beta-D-heptose 1-phosphate adenosyltransferase
MPTRLIELIENLPKSRIVLVGDLMLDRYIYANAERLSPEAPVPVLHFQSDEFRLGGAGSVASNLAALGADVRVVGLVGDDDDGKKLGHMLEYTCGSEGHALLVQPGRCTTCKVRLVGSAQHRHPQTMLRLDYERRSPIPADLADQVVRAVAAQLDGAAVLCVEDYNKGLLTPDVLRQVIELAAVRHVPVLIDPANLPDYSRYAGATCVKLNRAETARATGLPLEQPEQFEAAATKLLNMLRLEAAAITLDKDGAYLATRDGERRWLKATKARQVYDVTGAGDVVLATLAVTRAAGANWTEALTLANVAGGLEVEKFGAVPITPQEILQELLIEIHAHLGKQRTIDRLLPELARHRASGKRIVFTNGCFDIIHLGHVKYFQFAKAQGDILVVGVNTDASIRKLKGPKRPVVNEEDRCGVLEELESIDYLVKFDQDTPIDLINQIKPDVLVKGEDYTKQQVVGWDVVESYGGRVALAPLVDGRSTSSVIQRILEAYQAGS